MHRQYEYGGRLPGVKSRLSMKKKKKIEKGKKKIWTFNHKITYFINLKSEKDIISILSGMKA